MKGISVAGPGVGAVRIRSGSGIGRTALLVVLGIPLSLWPAAAPAGSFAPSETIFPATTRAWLSVADPQAFQESFDRTQYGLLLKDPVMKPFVDGFRAQLRSAGRQRLGRLGLSLEDLEKVPGGEIALAAIEPTPGVLAAILLVDTTGHEAETQALLEQVEKRLGEQKATKSAGPTAGMQVFKLPPEPNDVAAKPRQVAIVHGGGALVVGDSPAVVSQIVATLKQGRKDSLASLPAYQAVVARCGKQVPASSAPLRWFVDPLGYAKVHQAANPPREKRKGPDYVAILSRQGFDAVKGAGGVLFFGNGTREAQHHTLVYAPPLPGRQPDAADRFDLAARMLRFPNADRVEPSQWVPRDVSSWVAMHWDLAAAFASAEPLVDDIVGEKGVFDDVIASLKEDPDGPQIDVEKDLVACLGTRVSVLGDYATPIDVDSERLVFAIEAKDPERVAATVAKSMATDPDMQKVESNGHVIWEMIDRSSAIPKLEIETPGGAVAHADHENDAHERRRKLREKEEKLLPHSAVTVAHGHLLIASHRDFLERVLAASAGEGSLASAADYAVVSGEMKKLFPSAVAMRSFGRADEAVRPAFEMLRKGEMPKSKSVMGQLLNAALGDGKEGSVRAQKIDGGTLPDFELIRKYFGTVGLGMESVAEGWHFAGIALPRSQAEPDVARRPATPVGR
ncbi:MAG: hypothetical protein EBR28_08680 [Planctomycetia bacterium]|nr:hypothetical protein [Planctomycetia bacterium]